MHLDCRKNIEVYGAGCDLVGHTQRIVARLERRGYPELAEWLRQAVLAVVGCLMEAGDVESALDRVQVALTASASRLGPGRPILRAEAAVASMRRWWAVDPARDGAPRVVRQPAITRPVAR